MWYKQARNIDFDFTIFLWYNIPKNIFYCDVVPGQILNAAAQGGVKMVKETPITLFLKLEKRKQKRRRHNKQDQTTEKRRN